MTPSDIKYPTDLGLLNHARQILNKLIDKLYQPLKGKLEKKPRTDRKVAKKKRVSNQERRKAIKKQLRYVERNLGYIEDLREKVNRRDLLSKKEQDKLETIKKLEII